MKRAIPKILALVVVMTMLAGMISVASAESLFEANQEFTDIAEPNVVTGSQYVMEAVINIKSLPADGDPRGVKLIVGKTTSSNSDLNVWLVHNAIRVNDESWTYFSEHAYDFLSLVGQDMALKLVVDNGYLALYVNGALALNLADARLQVKADSKFSIGNWDGPSTVKSLTLKTLDTQTHGQTLYTLTEEKQGSVETNTLTGSRFVAEATLNISDFKTAQTGMGLKFIIGNGSESTEVWIGKNNIWANAGEWKNMINVDMTPYLNQDTAFKLLVDDSRYVLYVNDKPIWTLQDASLQPVNGAKLSMGGWDVEYTIKNLTIQTLEPNVLFEQNTPAANGLTPGVVVGPRYEADMDLNISAMSDTGIKMILGKNSGGNDVELWLAQNDIFVSCPNWIGSGLSQTNFHFADVKDQNINVKVTVADTTITVMINGEKAWEFTDDAFRLTEDSVYELGQWSATYAINRFKLTKLEEVTPGGDDPNPENPDPEDPNVLYQSVTPSSGAVTPGVTTGSEFVAEMVMNVSAFTNEYGNVKFLVGKNANGDEIQMELGKDGFWAITMPAEGESTYIGQNFGSFLWGNRLNEDISFKLVVDGDTWKLSVDGTQIWTQTDAALEATPESKFATGAWEVTHSVKSIKISKLTEDEGGDPGIEDGIPGNTESQDPETLYYWTGEYNGMNAGEGEEPVNFKVAELCGTDYELEAKVNVASIGSNDGNGLKLILRGYSDSDSGDMELWIGKDHIWVCTDSWKGHTAFDFSSYLNKDLTVKVVADGDTVTLSLDGTEVWTCTDASFALGTETNIELGGWDAKYVVKSVQVSKIEEKTPGGEGEGGNTGTGGEDGIPGNTESQDSETLYYWTGEYNGMNAGEGEEPVNFKVAELCGTDYELEAKVNVASIGSGDGRGVKVILRKHPASQSGDMELWIGKDHIWACTDSWKGHTAFDFSSYLNKDLTVKVVADGDTVTLSLDGTEVWTCTDAGFALGTETNIELGGWDARYAVKSVQVRKIEEKATGGEGEGGNTETGGETDPNALYSWTGVYTGMTPAAGAEHVNFVVDQLCGTKYNLEAVINVASIDNGDGRGVKLILGGHSAADSGDMELWIGKDHIWACTDSWKGHTEFDFAPYMNKDVKVQVAVNGDTIALYLDGTKVWSCTDAGFAKMTEDKIELGGWNANYLVKSVRVTSLDAPPETGDGIHVALPLILMIMAGCGLALVGTRKKWDI